jgi:hypothetical protein
LHSTTVVVVREERCPDRCQTKDIGKCEARYRSVFASQVCAQCHLLVLAGMGVAERSIFFSSIKRDFADWTLSHLQILREQI